FELDDLRNEVQIYRRRIFSHYRFYFQGHAGVARLPILGRCRCDHDRDYLVSDAGGTANRRNLRWRVCFRITKFSYHFDDGALPDPKDLLLPTLNGPSSQSKPSSLRLFWVTSINFDSISTCFGCEAFAWSTNASTMSKLSCVLRTISTPVCGQNVALAVSARP